MLYFLFHTTLKRNSNLSPKGIHATWATHDLLAKNTTNIKSCLPALYDVTSVTCLRMQQVTTMGEWK